MKIPTQSVLSFIYQKLFNHFSAQIYWVDTQGVYIGCNDLYCQFLKLTDMTLLLGKDPENFLKSMGLRVETKPLNRSENTNIFEKTYISDMTKQMFKVTQFTCFGITIVIEEDISGYLSKIHELEQQLDELKIKDDKTDIYLSSVTKIVPASIYWKDTNSVILGSNLFHTRIAGFSSPDEVIGKTEYDFVWKDQAKSIIENDQTIMKLGKGIQLEESAALSDGEIHTFLTSKEPLRDKNNNIIGVIGVSLDITEQKQAEHRAKIAESAALIDRAKAASEEEMRKTVMVLVGDIVHDLRTPIATIRSVGDILSMVLPMLLEILDESVSLGSQKINLLNKKQLNYIRENRIVTSLQSSVKMMDEFINSALIELANAQKAQNEGVASADLTKCSSRRILENTLDAYPLGQGIILHQNTSYDFFLMGNSVLIMKMLFNLIRNAVDQISLNGKGEIFVSTEETDTMNLIKIKDTAGGAPPDVISKIFDGYFTTKEHGTGIGLAYCKKTMEIFGGELNCNNAYGDFIEFALAFPKIKDQ